MLFAAQIPGTADPLKGQEGVDLSKSIFPLQTFPIRQQGLCSPRMFSLPMHKTRIFTFYCTLGFSRMWKCWEELSPKLLPASTCPDLPLHKSLLPSLSPDSTGISRQQSTEMGRKEGKGDQGMAEVWFQAGTAAEEEGDYKAGEGAWKQPCSAPSFPQQLSLESGSGRENLKSVGPRDKPGVKRPQLQP